MRAISLLLLLLSLSPCLPVSAADTWSLEYHRGLSDRQRGDLEVTLYGQRMFSHAFCEPAETFFPDRIPGNARVELVFSVSEAEGTVWGSNPSGEAVPETPARIGLILHRDWSSASGRWYSLARIDLRPGVHRLVVDVAPYAWKNVLGKIGNESASRKEQWRRPWGDPARIGICAGGFFHGHGVECLEGVGTVRVLSLRVRP